MEQTTLYFRQGSSDKVYQASIEQQNGDNVVNFAFGRRGTHLVRDRSQRLFIGLP
jgi:bifunctional non-homologous end joining protein LigD